MPILAKVSRETIADQELSHAWNQIQVEEYAKTQHELIVVGEQTFAPAYCRLGRALKLLQEKRGRRGWGDYLESLGIHRVRACKARAIARHFSTPEAVAGLSVEAAYEQSKSRRAGGAGRRQGRAHEGKAGSGQAAAQGGEPGARELGAEEIGAFLADVRDRADVLVNAAAFADADRRAELIPLYRDALARLQYFGRMLGAEDEPRPAGSP